MEESNRYGEHLSVTLKARVEADNEHRSFVDVIYGVGLLPIKPEVSGATLEWMTISARCHVLSVSLSAKRLSRRGTDVGNPLSSMMF